MLLLWQDKSLKIIEQLGMIFMKLSESLWVKVSHMDGFKGKALPQEGGSVLKTKHELTAGFLYRAGAETPLNFRETFHVFRSMILKTFLSGGYPNRSSGIHRWGLDLSTGYPNTYFSWFSGYPPLTLVFLPGDEEFWFFSLRCLSRKSGSQHQLRIKTLPSWTPTWSFLQCLAHLDDLHGLIKIMG